MLVCIAVLVLVPSWLLLARSRFLAGDPDVPSTNSRVPQLYGYSVCLITLVVALTSVSSLVERLFDIQDPLHSESRWGGFDASLSSFEAYKATYQRAERMMPSPDGRTTEVQALPDEALKTRYEALRADRLNEATFQARRQLTSSGLTLVLAMALFAGHWRWLKRRVEVPEPSPR